MLYRSIAACLLVSTLASAAWNQEYSEALAAARALNFDRAETILRRLCQTAEGDIQHAAAAQDLGMTLHLKGNDREAGVWLERAVNTWRDVPGRPERLSQSLFQLGVVDHRLGDYAAAESVFRSALGERRITTATRLNTLYSLSDLLREQGRMGEARSVLSATPSEGLPPRARAEFLMAMASLERESRNSRESVNRWNEALELARALSLPGLEAICLRGLGEAWLDQGDTARAFPLLRRSVFLLESAASTDPGGPEVFQMANSLRAISQAYLADQKPLQAEEAARRGLAEMDKVGALAHPHAAALYDALAEAQAAHGTLAGALESLARAEAIVTAHFGAASAPAISTSAKRGVLEARAGQTDAAVNDLAASLRHLANAGPDLARTRLVLMGYYAAALDASSRGKEARAVRRAIRTQTAE